MDKDHVIEDDLDLYKYSIRHTQSDLDFQGPDPGRVKMQKQVTDMQKISKSLMAKLQVNERKSTVCVLCGSRTLSVIDHCRNSRTR